MGEALTHCGPRRRVVRPVGAALGRRLELGDGQTTRAGAGGEAGEHRRVVVRVFSGIY